MEVLAGLIENGVVKGKIDQDKVWNMSEALEVRILLFLNLIISHHSLGSFGEGEIVNISTDKYHHRVGVQTKREW